MHGCQRSSNFPCPTSLTASARPTLHAPHLWLPALARIPRPAPLTARMRGPGEAFRSCTGTGSSQRTCHPGCLRLRTVHGKEDHLEKVCRVGRNMQGAMHSGHEAEAPLPPPAGTRQQCSRRHRSHHQQEPACCVPGGTGPTTSRNPPAVFQVALY
eukprot:364201-Chlamydomonas_euryale.AAC.7